jgi:hypothetical protein
MHERAEQLSGETEIFVVARLESSHGAADMRYGFGGKVCGETGSAEHL